MLKLCVCVCELSQVDNFPSLFLSAYQQDQLVQSGVIPRLVCIIKEYPDNDPLINVCLLALCNLTDIGKY